MAKNDTPATGCKTETHRTIQHTKHGIIPVNKKISRKHYQPGQLAFKATRKTK